MSHKSPRKHHHWRHLAPKRTTKTKARLPLYRDQQGNWTEWCGHLTMILSTKSELQSYQQWRLGSVLSAHISLVKLLSDYSQLLIDKNIFQSFSALWSTRTLFQHFHSNWVWFSLPWVFCYSTGRLRFPNRNWKVSGSAPARSTQNVSEYSWICELATIEVSLFAGRKVPKLLLCSRLALLRQHFCKTSY